MIFGLHPALGFLPLVVYIALSFMGLDVTVVLLVSVILGAVLTGTGLFAFGQSIAAGLGSFLGMIGFIILMGSGVGELLTKTRVAHYIVWLVMNKLGVNSITKGMFAVMFTSFLLVALLGSLAGGNAILAPIVIPIVAALGMTPSTLSIILHGGGATGLFLGPFVPPVLTTMALAKISYVDYLIWTGLPVSIIVWLVTIFIGRRVQKQTVGKYSYGPEDMVTSDSALQNADGTPEFVNAKTKRAFSVFALLMILLVAFGIATKAGAAFVITVMLIIGLFTGKAAGLSFEESLKAIVTGGSRMYWIFFMFILYEPLLGFIGKSGAFTWLTEWLTPYLMESGKGLFLFISTIVGLFGVPGAAVAQEKIIDDLFGAMARGINMPMEIWGMSLLLGSQLDYFAFPTGDIIGQMGLARSKDLISMMKQGFLVTGAIILYLIVICVFYEIGTIH